MELPPAGEKEWEFRGEAVPGERESEVGYRPCEWVCDETAATVAAAENGDGEDDVIGCRDGGVVEVVFVETWTEDSWVVFVLIVRAPAESAALVGPFEVEEI